MINNVELVKASFDNSKLLYDWAMDKEVRKNSFNSDEFSYESHCKWLKKQLNNNDCDILLCKINKDFVGQTRLYYEDGIATINYSIAKEFRRKGYASLMIESVINYVLQNNEKIDTFIAEVKLENVPSIKIFEKLNFSKEKDGNKYVFRKNR